MDHDHIHDHQIVERYLMGQLSAAESARFEEHYLTCEACLEELENAGRFHHALQAVAAEDAARATAAARLGVLARLTRHRWPAAVIVTALLLVPAGLTLRQIRSLDAERSRLAADLERVLSPQANTAVLRLSPERDVSGGAEPANRITLTSEEEWIVLSLAVGDPHPGTYRALLRGPEGDVVWEGSGLERDGSGALGLSLHSTFFEAGDYQLRVEAVSATGAARFVAPFSFRVIR